MCIHTFDNSLDGGRISFEHDQLKVRLTDWNSFTFNQGFVVCLKTKTFWIPEIIILRLTICQSIMINYLILLLRFFFENNVFFLDTNLTHIWWGRLITLYLPQEYLRERECNERTSNSNPALRFLIPCRSPLHHAQIHCNRE